VFTFHLNKANEAELCQVRLAPGSQNDNRPALRMPWVHAPQGDATLALDTLILPLIIVCGATYVVRRKARIHIKFEPLAPAGTARVAHCPFLSYIRLPPPYTPLVRRVRQLVPLFATFLTTFFNTFETTSFHQFPKLTDVIYVRHS